jgi:hypothetical protein
MKSVSYGKGRQASGLEETQEFRGKKFWKFENS